MAKAELAAIPRPMDRFRRAVEIGRIILEEVTGSLLMAPYGARAARQYFALPQLHKVIGSKYAVEQKEGVAIVRGVRYGPKDRNLVDLYIPLDHVAGLEAPDDLVTFLRDPYPITIEHSDVAKQVAAVTTKRSGDVSAGTASGRVEPAPLALFVHGGVWYV